MKRSDQKLSNTALINLILYILLLIATPFLLLQNYLQDFIGKLSSFEFEFLNISIPYVLLFAFLVLVSLIIFNIRRFTIFSFLSLIFIILLITIGQSVSDFYFNHRFYDLQQNWHYFAYAIFSYIAFRYFKAKQKSDSLIILFTFLMAISVSTFDEFIQIYISNRIFDVGDIGKDTLGGLIGLYFIFFVVEKGKIVRSGWKIREKNLKNYFGNAFSLLVISTIFTLILISVASLLTDIGYLFQVILIIFAVFTVVFLIIHFSQKLLFRRIFLIAVIACILVQGFLYLKYRKRNIIYHSPGITIYKGIPLLFFDVMIFENGSFRPVDKKIVFNKRDINTICHYATDILIIGSGEKGSGGNGFPEKIPGQFIYNSVKEKPLQVIILKTPEALRKFNHLRKKGLNVVLIFRNN